MAKNGLCECGCGNKTNLAKKTNHKRQTIKGMPVKFIPGHSSKGKNNPNWRGGLHIRKGYTVVWNQNHINSNVRNEIRESWLIAERILGKPIPLKSVIHHVDLKCGQERPNDIVICENQAYHGFLHRRTLAFYASGYANWRRCQFCKRYDDPNNLIIYSHIKKCYHKLCRIEYRRNYYAKINA